MCASVPGLRRTRTALGRFCHRLLAKEGVLRHRRRDRSRHGLVWRGVGARAARRRTKGCKRRSSGPHRARGVVPAQLTLKFATQARKGRELALAPARFLRENMVLLAILLGGALARLMEFGAIPPGLNQDEASLGYDAYAVLHHGIDRNGFHNPLMFVSWGSGMSALPGYLTAPFILLFGLSPTALRAVYAIAGLLSVGLLYAV